MRGAALDLDGVDADAFACSLYLAVKRWFENERRTRRARFLLDSTSREVRLPISSSELTTKTIGGALVSSCKSFAAHKACTKPAFISKMPGPRATPSETVNGLRASVPAGQTVS